MEPRTWPLTDIAWLIMGHTLRAVLGWNMQGICFSATQSCVVPGIDTPWSSPRSPATRRRRRDNQGLGTSRGLSAERRGHRLGTLRVPKRMGTTDGVCARGRLGNFYPEVIEDFLVLPRE